MPLRMPVRLWQEMELVENAWKNLLETLNKEWNAIVTNDIDSLWPLIAEKEKVAASVASAEKSLAKVADRILLLCKNITKSPNDKQRWDGIIELANPCEVMRLEAWRMIHFCLKEDARIRLKRHEQWLEHRKKFAHEMLGLLLHQKDNSKGGKAATYGPGNQINHPTSGYISHLSV